MRTLAALTVLLTVVGAFAGRWAGPSLARANATVRLAEHVALEEAQGLTERTLESQAFRETGRNADDLFAEARKIKERFRLGGMLLGMFCGLAVGLKMIRHARRANDPFYHIDQEACVSCGRCFAFCPRERLRREPRESDQT